MKIAVYTIAKNEEQFVATWAVSAEDADYRIILDTGSTDNTVSAARGLGVVVHERTFDPWRFDHARNLSLGVVPEDADLCVALDMDEVLLPSWRAELERMWDLGVTRPRYEYTWSWNSDGTPGLVYGGDKIHARNGYVWKHPVHEVLVPTGEETQGWCGLKIHHHPDNTKSRGQYLPLLELAVAEDPDDDRNAHYLAREYFFNDQKAKAREEFKRHLRLPRATWKPERAASMRYLYKITNDVSWLHKAIAECPEHREARVELALRYYSKEAWRDCLDTALQALRIKERPLEYLTEALAWGSVPHDLAAVSAFRLGYYHEALAHGRRAAELAPGDERLAGNLQTYLAAAAVQ